MANVTIRVRGIDEALHKSPLSKPVRRKIILISLRAGASVIQAGLMRNIPVQSGQTRSRINQRFFSFSGGRVMVIAVGGKSISENGFDILRGLEEGTGIYGPRGARIVPKNAKVLAWRSRKPVSGTKTGGWIFAKSIKGMKPRRPFAKTFKGERKRAERVFSTTFARALATTSNLAN